ncbi:6-phosphogluconate dehydratase [Rhodothalassium salexigens DSM 2132]|uniref:Phosphogluconate dehydratase n=1 Tax=Rhodothalassium salexigens DSM 2132 TaxID=1188247 RepID=A0A4R2PPE6_RHOSA|nr:phosphogluconate dehydratase [Rhodothalassium salexigens]MBB4210803.1 phosphogluconate dehydratase [Rhodothalassium salexigens DSM 2132]MBK1639136.1 phosphogluconate dehydratase [Rhodothalassium salexigens DSM 2132]TCP37642.1 6-phosphogluconate dehydratase [Rhodothalassium salexigens DSM 2132]
MHPTVVQVTERIERRSSPDRRAYLDRLEAARAAGPGRGRLSCGNLAHGFAASPDTDKLRLKVEERPNLAIVSAYNDMLSAHQPFARFPDLIKAAAREMTATAQVAGGVPAMCDGVTQGQPGMELSLFSRDTIAMATAVALSHNMFDAALCLGVCDKIVPGLLIGALAFGHLPVIFVPAGPMPSGLPNAEKARIRKLFAQGQVSRDQLLEAESRSYHAPGTCTFYGTANSNQMIMEVMGLHLPGSAFVNPNTPLRDALTAEAARQACRITDRWGDDYRPLGRVVDARAIVNAIVGLLATGGSTNHTMHLTAIARAAGLRITLDDFRDLSAVTPSLARIYPNGEADVNHFHAAGGMGFLVRELLDARLLHRDKLVVMGEDLGAYTREPGLDGDRAELVWRAAPAHSGDPDVLRPTAQPFQPTGGLQVMAGNLGRGIMKVSAVAPEHRVVEAPARVFATQGDFEAAFKAGALDGPMVAVIRFQGPRANGMPELHKLTPHLSVLQDRGCPVALVTDGRMSGASGRVPAAIHVTPEAAAGGPLARVRDGDPMRVDGETGRLDVLVPAQELARRADAEPDLAANGFGLGRELFAGMRRTVSDAEAGASVLFPDG